MAGYHATAQYLVLTAALLSAHIFMAVFNPSTRPALHGMLFGRVRRSWAAKHHAAWLAVIDQTDGPTSAVPHASSSPHAERPPR
jgi:cytochrome b subunit of formate dehydrogenase